MFQQLIASNVTRRLVGAAAAATASASSRNHLTQVLKNDLHVATAASLFKHQNIEKKNQSSSRVVLSQRIDDSRTFGSLALFGLWGKSPEKSAAAPQAAGVDPTTAVQPPATPTPSPTPSSSDPLDLSSGYIPEPPAILDESIVLNALGEPTLHSLGLASNWPPGLIQQLLEVFHVDFGLEWFQAIILFTVALRLCLFPINVISQRSAVKMRKISPQMMHYQEKMSDAKATGNTLEVARATHELIEFMKVNNFSPLKMFLPMIQLPFMLSTFMAIRGMAKLPVESLTTGGALWFTDLTLADPFYLLPLAATASIIAVIHRGVDTGISANNMNPTTRLAFYGFGAISLPFFCFMPSGVSFYICISNFISLLYSVFFSFKPVKRACGIPVLSEYDMLKIKESQKKQQDFFKGFMDKYQNMKVVQEVKERERLKERMYQQASTKVPERTFKTNPKLQQQQPKSLSSSTNKKEEEK